MTIELNNIGMIKEANVKLDGLTVIAGENDTGKSTVGKALFVMLASIQMGIESEKAEGTAYFSADNIFKKVFNTTLSKNAYINLESKFGQLHFQEVDGFQSSGMTLFSYHENKEVLFIETPLIWNFTDFFRDIAQIESQMGIKVDYPFLMKDLNFKLFIKNASNGIDIKDKVISLMNGEFKKDEMGRFFFDKKGQKIELLNTATGIKYFGLFQVLSQNNYLNENTVLILDEPEVHLHPKWQLEMAKLIVELVKNGVKILVNSHSPYMIEALKRYADREKIEDIANFYLAEDGYIKKVNDSNSQTLVSIYEKLSEPYDLFEEMESDRFNNG
ncbi:MAG: AAA family ATPase [Sulfuricurvum sp.]|jgi:predicted ATPase|uniref:AAA family ATPase n=1 Tax=Sulfuricurvum sp. TaxID=2025608 RepID=UPI0025D32100|nr:AAA family ATPase [Sulfuricurvum sp.]MCK9374368.1 AAA family ATPase [Sulfuricurvum sp.]